MAASMASWMELDLLFHWKCSRPRSGQDDDSRKNPCRRRPDPRLLRPTREATFACLPCMLSRCSIFRSTGSSGHYDSEDKNVLKPQLPFQMTTYTCIAFYFLLTSVVVLKPKDDQEGGRRTKDRCMPILVRRVRRRPTGPRSFCLSSSLLFLRDFSRVFRRSDRPYVINEFLLR